MTATDANFPAVTGTSTSFTVNAGSASQLGFTTQPGGGASGANLGPQPVVTVEDAWGNTVTSSTASVTLSISTHPTPTGTLACTPSLSKNASAGVATFSGCKITGTVGSYSLQAASTGLTSATSSSFTVFGRASKVVFTTQPGGSSSGTAWATQPVVTVEDSSGNTVLSSTASVTLAINTQPGGGTLSCTGGLTTTASAGVATFTGCEITGTAGSYTLAATSTGLTTAISSSFIVSGPASQVVFTTPPGGGSNGTAWGTQPVVTVEDSSGNTVTGSAASVSLAINTQPGSGTLTCSGGLSKTASAGIATFTGCKITGTAGSYTIAASATGLTGDTSSSFTITAGAASQLVFTTQPGGGTNGTVWTTQPVVTIEDASGNTVTSPTATVTLVISAHPNPVGTLTCTSGLSPTTSAGVATYTGCKITGKVGTYSLKATSGALSVTSNTFTA